MAEKREDKVRGALLEEVNSEYMPRQSELFSHSTTPSEEGTASVLSVPGTELDTILTRATSPMELSSLNYNCPDFGEQEDWPAAGEWTVVYSKRTRKAWALQERLEQQDRLKTQRNFNDDNIQGQVSEVRRTVGPSIAESPAVEELAKSMEGKRTKKNRKRKAGAKQVHSQERRDVDMKTVEKECEPAKGIAIKATKAYPQEKKKEAEHESILHRFSKRHNLAKIALFILAPGLCALLFGIATGKDMLESTSPVVEHDPDTKEHSGFQPEARWKSTMPKMQRCPFQAVPGFSNPTPQDMSAISV